MPVHCQLITLGEQQERICSSDLFRQEVSHSRIHRSQAMQVQLLDYGF